MRYPYLTDTIIRDGIEIESHLLRPPCIHMGAKKYLPDGEPLTAKETGCCQKPPSEPRAITFTPVYECSEFRRCAPFAGKIEDEYDPTKPCQGCRSYKAKLDVGPAQTLQ